MLCYQPHAFSGQRQAWAPALAVAAHRHDRRAAMSASNAANSDKAHGNCAYLQQG